MSVANDVVIAILEVRAKLAPFTFRAVNEEDLQTQVAKVLRDPAGGGLVITREVIAKASRYDIEVVRGITRLVLELKVSGSASAVERQAQKYALTDGVDAVLLVTTSSRLARHLLAQPPTLGGKVFEVITLRTF